MTNTQRETVQEEEKLLSGYVPDAIYWEFKKAAADRKEKLKEALMHAALLYIHACDPIEEETKDGR